MTLDDALKHEKIFDKRATGYDIVEFLDTKYFSKSKQKHIRYGDMHLQHFIRVFQNKDLCMENIKIIEATLKQIVEDVENGDLTAIEELLKQINTDHLLNFITNEK